MSNEHTKNLSVHPSWMEIALDLSSAGDPRVGDEVTMLGKSGDQEITISELAGWWDTTPLSVLMSLNQRYPYVYSGGDVA